MMLDQIKGYIHVHSNYSYDGKDSIKELAAFFVAKGYRFICLTDHADDFDQMKMKAFLEDCAKYSNAHFTIAPGLEYRCNDLVHLLGMGVTELCFSNDPVEVSYHIKQNGGIAIIAHPRGYEDSLTHKILGIVDGLEIWSGQKDSRFFPHWENLQTFKNLKQIYPSLVGLGGADLHTLENYFQLDTIIHTTSKIFEPSVLNNGVSSIQGAHWTLSLGSDFSLQTILILKIFRIALNIAKRLMGR